MYVAAHGMLGEPSGDFYAPVGTGRADRCLVENLAAGPCCVQRLLQLDDGLAVPPSGGDDDIGAISTDRYMIRPPFVLIC
jgi:hypothetical protein